MKTVRKMICLMLSLSIISLHVAPAHAAMIQNKQIITQVQSELSREQLVEMLNRDEAQRQLQAMGVSADEVKQRVDQMTDAEVASLNGKLAELPAGGDILGLLVLLFLVFVITDMLGATDVFPFVNKI